MIEAPTTPDPPLTKRPKWFWFRSTASVFFAALTALTLALWVRSYSWEDDLVCSANGEQALIATSLDGNVGASLILQNDYRNYSHFYFASNAPGKGLRIPTTPVKTFHFGWSDQPLSNGGRIESLSLSLSHYVIAMVAAAMTVSPWVSIRFSLRTLLFATTLLAVVLGLEVWTRR